MYKMDKEIEIENNFQLYHLHIFFQVLLLEKYLVLIIWALKRYKQSTDSKTAVNSMNMKTCHNRSHLSYPTYLDK